MVYFVHQPVAYISGERSCARNQLFTYDGSGAVRVGGVSDRNRYCSNQHEADTDSNGDKRTTVRAQHVRAPTHHARLARPTTPLTDSSLHTRKNTNVIPRLHDQAGSTSCYMLAG